jgi:hypothetical protein
MRIARLRGQKPTTGPDPEYALCSLANAGAETAAVAGFDAPAEPAFTVTGPAGKITIDDASTGKLRGRCARLFFCADAAAPTLEVHGMRVLLLAVAALFGGALHAATIELNFSFENDGDLSDPSFGTVLVSDDEVDRLSFEINVDTSVLGIGADVEQFGFNLDFANSIALISGTNSAQITQDDKVKGRNSIFDYVVDFGQGQPFFSTVEFVIEGMGLDLSNLLGAPVSTQNSKPDAQFMAHIQSTSTPGGSESIGGVVPVPGAIWLFLSAIGLAGTLRLRQS